MTGDRMCGLKGGDILSCSQR